MVITGVDQQWVADTHTSGFEEEFAFVAVILDACSRRVIGWALDRTLEDELPVWCTIPTAALNMPAATKPSCSG